MTSEILVGRNRPQISDQILATFNDARTGFVVDAMGRRGALDYRIKAVTTRSAFSGRALTVRVRPWDNLAAHVALEHITPGDVLMITAGGFTDASIIGEKYLGMARNKGAVAVVLDGMVRDIRNYDQIGIPVFALGITPNSSHKDGFGEIGLPISMAGVAVNSGDVVVGDEDGVVVVPHYLAADTAAKLATITAKENEMFNAIAAGGEKPAAMAAISTNAPIRYVD